MTNDDINQIKQTVNNLQGCVGNKPNNSVKGNPITSDELVKLNKEVVEIVMLLPAKDGAPIAHLMTTLSTDNVILLNAMKQIAMECASKHRSFKTIEDIANKARHKVLGK